MYFGPEELEVRECNWVQTLRGKSFKVMYRMHAPLESWFDKTWKLNDFEFTE